jgi:hypothetical protein
VDAKSIGFNGEEAMQLMMKAGYDVTGDDICEVVTLDENDVVLLVDDPEDVPIGAYLPKLYPSLDLDLAGLS